MATATTDSAQIMEKLLVDSPDFLQVQPGELVEGTVVFKGKNKLLLDIGGVATGIVSGRELRDSLNTFKKLGLGDTASAMILEEENDEGMIVLSLRMASQMKAWERFHDMIISEETMDFTAQEANKGGLIANIDGIRAFLPVSQLAPINYPRVNNADTSEILSRLQKFLGHTFTVKVITMDEEAGKIVVSEREAMAEQRSKALEELTIGSVKEGIVSGIVKFGFFVAFDGLEGLVHISEIAWGHVKNPVEYAKLGDRVTVKVIGVDGDKLSLSVKQLTKDPWEEIAEKYPIGKKVQGTIVRFADYGAFLKLEQDINGLIHLSELSHHPINDPSEVINIGQKVDAQVISIDPDERRIGLSLKALQPIDKETLERLKQEREAKEAEKEALEENKAERKEKEKKAAEVEEEKAEEASDETVEAEETADEPAEEAPTEEADESESTDASEGAFVASKTGKKYYASDSAQGQKIKEDNRVYFASEKEAEEAGYSK